MSSFNFSPRTIAALVMGLGVSFYATAGMGKLRIISVDAQRFEAEIPLVDEPVPDSANVRLADRQYGLGSNTAQASQLHFSRQGNRILVNGPMPPEGGDPLKFALEVSWPEGTMVREFQIQPLVLPSGGDQPKKLKEKQPTPKEKNTVSDGNKAIQPDDAKLDGLKLGDLKVISALGQPLSVEVDIYGNALRKNSKGVKVQVFPDVGIAGSDPELMQTLSTLQYKIEKRPSGRHILKLRSNKIVNEPILPLQIEAVAGNERSIKQYTVLLDPAGYQVAKSHSASVYAGSTLSSESPRKQRATAAKRGTDKSLKPLKVYRVLKGDSLSEIAGKMRGREGLAERMQQLKDANPGAFIRGDINLLRAGATLHYPAHWRLSASHDVVRQRPAASSERYEAKTEASTKQQIAQRAKSKASAPTAKPQAVAPSVSPQTSASAKQTAPAATKPSVSSQTAPAAKVVEPAAPQSPKPAATAQAQNATPAKPVTPPPSTPVETKTEVPPAAAATSTIEPQMDVASAPVQAVASAAIGETPEKLARVEELKSRLAEQDAQLKKADEVAAALQAELAKLNPGDSAAPAADVDSEGDGLFTLVGDYYRPIAAGALIVLAAGGGFYAWRRRRKKQQGAYESLEGMTGEVSGLALTTLMSANQPGSVEFDMTDPLVEAESHLQDGSTDKALDILREGLTREPMRQDVRLRLLEILARNNEQHAFVEEALVAKTLFGVNSPLWQRTVELAQTLDPVPDLFANGAAEQTGDASGQRKDKGGVSSSAPAGI